MRFLNKQIIRVFKDDSLKRSMLLSTMCKPIGMVISMLYTPLLLSYLGNEVYGLWATILSVINWINYFDVGIAQGLRNTLAKYITQDNRKQARYATSTGYIVLTAISSGTFFIGLLLILILDINVLFNSTIDIRVVLIVSFTSICINFILSLCKSQLYALQKAEYVGMMTVAVQGINLIGIVLLSLFCKGSLLAVAVLVSTSGIIVNVAFTKWIWNNNDYLKPSVKAYSKEEFHHLFDFGIKFFFIQIAALILYSTDNFIVLKLFGSSAVTPYQTTFVAFGIINALFAAMLSPLWSQYTVALEREDYNWIKRSIFKLDCLLPAIAVLLLIGVVIFKPLSQIWLQRTLEYDNGLIICMAFYYFITIWASIYSTALNGMGRVNLQLTLSCVAAIINIPLSIFLGKTCEMMTTGVCLGTVISMLVSTVPITVDTHLFLNRQSNKE